MADLKNPYLVDFKRDYLLFKTVSEFIDHFSSYDSLAEFIQVFLEYDKECWNRKWKTYSINTIEKRLDSLELITDRDYLLFYCGMYRTYFDMISKYNESIKKYIGG